MPADVPDKFYPVIIPITETARRVCVFIRLIGEKKDLVPQRFEQPRKIPAEGVGASGFNRIIMYDHNFHVKMGSSHLNSLDDQFSPL